MESLTIGPGRNFLSVHISGGDDEEDQGGGEVKNTLSQLFEPPE